MEVKGRTGHALNSGPPWVPVGVLSHRTHFFPKEVTPATAHVVALERLILAVTVPQLIGQHRAPDHRQPIVRLASSQ